MYITISTDRHGLPRSDDLLKRCCEYLFGACERDANSHLSWLMSVHNYLQAHRKVLALRYILESERQTFAVVEYKGRAELVERRCDVLGLGALKNLPESRQRYSPRLPLDDDAVIPELPVK